MAEIQRICEQDAAWYGSYAGYVVRMQIWCSIEILGKESYKAIWSYLDMNLHLSYRPLGPLYTNVYLIENRDSKQCVLVDPAYSKGFDTIMNMIKASECELSAILLTHGHFDHIGAADQIRSATGVEIYACEAEKSVLSDPVRNLSASMGDEDITLTADRWVKDGDILKLAGIEFQVFQTPGHTVGGVDYYIAEQEWLFSGDSLFEESIGRTDNAGMIGAMKSLIESVNEKLMVLPEDTVVYPGHGGITTIGHEKVFNPFLAM